MRALIVGVWVVLSSGELFGQRSGWQPSPGHTQTLIWPGTPPDAQFGPPPNTETTPVQAENDPVDNVNNSLVYYIALKNAGVPVEMHLYARGGHGFGLRASKYPIAEWPQLVETWLKTMGMTSKQGLGAAWPPTPTRLDVRQ